MSERIHFHPLVRSPARPPSLVLSLSWENGNQRNVLFEVPCLALAALGKIVAQAVCNFHLFQRDAIVEDTTLEIAFDDVPFVLPRAIFVYYISRLERCVDRLKRGDHILR